MTHRINTQNASIEIMHGVETTANENGTESKQPILVLAIETANDETANIYLTKAQACRLARRLLRWQAKMTE